MDTDSGGEEDELHTPARVLHKYFVSITGSVRKRRLHLGGACWRLPGKDYAMFEEFGEELPDSSVFHTVCKQCFPRGVQGDVPAEESSSSGSSMTSETESV